MNPCPCGYLGHFSGKCRCSPDNVLRYRRRISGPLLDRIDLHVEVPALSASQLKRAARGERSEVVSGRVKVAREIQLRRQGMANARLDAAACEAACAANDSVYELLVQAASQLSFSARAYFRVLRVARTIADLAGCEPVLEGHVAEALGYRGAAPT